MHHEIAESVHRFAPAQPSSGALSPNGALADTTFRPAVQQLPKALLGVSSFSSQPSWYTSSVPNYCKPFTDLPLMDFAIRHGCLQSLKNMWLGQLVNVKHHMVLRHTYDGGRPSEWFFPLRWVDGAAGVFWPAEQRGDLSGWTYMVPKVSGVMVNSLCMPFCDLDKWEAQEIVWRSPAWVAAETKGQWLQSGLWHNIRVFIVGPPRPVLQVCASCGFWDISAPFLRRLKSHLGSRTAADGDLVSLLESLLKDILNVSAEDAIPFLEKRLSFISQDEGDMAVAREVMQSDEAQELLDDKDKKVAATVSDHYETRCKTSRALVEHIAERRRASTTRRAEQSGVGEKKKTAKRAKATKPTIVPGGPLTQAEAKIMLPPELLYGAVCTLAHGMPGTPR